MQDVLGFRSAGHMYSSLNTHVPYTRQLFKGENFWGFVAICESFLRKIWGVALFGGTSKSFLREKFIFHQFVKVFCYMVVSCTP